MLGVLKTQLEAPAAYDPYMYLEEMFVSATSSCGAEDCSYTNPDHTRSTQPHGS